MWKRCIKTFIYSSFFGMLINLIIEIIVRAVSGFDYSPVTPEFIALFPSVSIAYAVDTLLYGFIGLTYALMLFVFGFDRIGFVIQSIIYYITTGIVCIPIIIFIWRLDKYPSALISTIIGFIVTDIIMTVVSYNITKKNIASINAVIKK